MCNGYIPPNISIFFIYCDGEKDNKDNRHTAVAVLYHYNCNNGDIPFCPNTGDSSDDCPRHQR